MGKCKYDAITTDCFNSQLVKYLINNKIFNISIIKFKLSIQIIAKYVDTI
jgi:hypothetical protein